MIKNYFKIAWRTIWKNKIFSGINIFGLSLGLTCSILIMMWVQDEYNVDSFHKNLNRIFAVTSTEYMDGTVRGSYDTPGLLADELSKTIPDIELACAYGGGSYRLFSSGEKKIKLLGSYASPDFFKIFSYPLIEGTALDALNDPDDIAISEKMAISFFGSSRTALGQSLKFDNYKQLKISAVFKDIASNSSERFEYILNWEFYKEREPWLTEWHNSGAKTFVLLKSRMDISNVNSKIKEYISRYDKEYKESDRLELALQPYGKKYLYSNFKNGYIDGGRIEYVRLFGLVALFILLIACINFMNLSTARSLKRAQEIGVRKVIGALRGSLIFQFIGEALLYSFIAVVVSVVLLTLLLPVFNQLTSKNLIIPFDQLDFWLKLTVLTLVTGFIAGSYPAFMLSSFRPITILKNNLKLSLSSVLLRKGLVVFQFMLCIVFIVSMMVISKQVDYIQTKNLGYQKSNLIYLPVTGTLANNFNVFKNEALKIPGIINITQMSQRPIEVESTTGGVMWKGKTPNTNPRFTQLAADYDFVTTMQTDLVAGRDFSTDYNDSSNYLINEKALKLIGYEDPIGKPLTFWGKKGSIIGVVKDFHFHSFHVPIDPLIIRLIGKPRWGYAMIRFEHDKLKSVLEALGKLHQTMNPDFTFDHQFADEEYNEMYISEHLIKSLAGYFTMIAIFISCLGLLGLVIFSAEQRTKEIGIRKVIGASISSIFVLLSKEFLILIGIAFLFASPIAWWSMTHWLNHYAYHITLSWWIFVVAGFFAMTIALLTVCLQAFKAAIANPIIALHTE